MEIDNIAGAPVQETRTRTFPGSLELKFDTDRLKIFYQRIFPYQLFFKWLSYNQMKNRNQNTLQSIDDKDVSSDYFYNREFSFTLANDVYCRYLCYKTAEEFKSNLVSRVPHKIDIGAVFNFAPSRHLTADKKAFIPIEKEMVFDIDMDAYDDVRTCCQGANVCQKCWSYVNIAAKLLTDMLRDDFDMTNCLWVFSGRRGVHCWICDPEARNMTNEMRQAVTNFFNVGTGNELSGKLNLNYPLHPSLRKAYEFLFPFFEQVVIIEQDLLSSQKHQDQFLKYLNSEIRDQVRDKWRTMGGNGSEMWAYFRQAHANWKSKNLGTKFRAGEKDLAMEELVLCYLYPRLDANVSTGINHLLKSPFCIHPKTGNICVPFDPNNVHNFKLDEVPTLTKVINELGELTDKQLDTTTGALTLPCLEPYTNLFKKHIRNCVVKQDKLDLQEEQMPMDF